MTDMNSMNEPPRIPSPATRSSGTTRGAAARLRPLALAALIFGGVTGGVALAAAGYAATTPEWREGARLSFVQRAVARALDGVGASAAQEAKIHDIVAARFAELAPNPDERAAMRKQALALLAAPAIDRAAVEKMRTEAVARFDAKSKTIVAGLLDIADQLTPDQRVKLAAHIEARAERHGAGGAWGHWGHWGHRPMDGQDHGPGDGRDRD